jgi:hypothetical protein
VEIRASLHDVDSFDGCRSYFAVYVQVISFSVRRLECRWFARMLSAADSRVSSGSGYVKSIWSIQ